MGRRWSLRDIGRIAREAAPLVERAARQPSVELAVRHIARDEGLTVEAARTRWRRLHEADLLLESGGDPDIVSVSNAVGIAQWLAETGRGNGLRVNLAESNRLTRRIDALKLQIAWREYLLLPDADLTAPGKPPGLTPQNAGASLDALRRERDSLRAKRRVVDHRYDPEKAVFAQARYLARLYARFPSLDWVYQAYHGGEGGATRTLSKFLGSAWPGSTAAAIRYGRKGGRLRFEDVYFATTPGARPAAFAYLYGRSDDHRHYWWKLRTAADAIALLRRDPAQMRRVWESYLPGRYAEAAWYPNAHSENSGAFADLLALDRALKQGRLLPVAASPGLAAPRPAPLDPQNARRYAALRPEAKGALLLIAAAYRQAGGKGPLTVHDMALTERYVELARRRKPAPPSKAPLLPPAPEIKTLPVGPPEDFDFHATGLAFDIAKPADSAQRKRLDYAIGLLENRHIVWRTEKREEQPRSPGWHVVPNPRYAAALARIAATGRAPKL